MVEARETGVAEGTATQPRALEPVRQRSATQPHGAELVTDHGRTTIANGVVAKIAAIAAREVNGVHDLGAQGASGALSSFTTRVTGGDTRTQGVTVEVGTHETAIDLAITVDYGVSIPNVSEAVRGNIMNRIQAMTGLTVKEVNIDVTDLFFPEEEAVARVQDQRRVE
jgi:uncharacterized alkaline shock family protein YloU